MYHFKIYFILYVILYYNLQFSKSNQEDFVLNYNSSDIKLIQILNKYFRGKHCISFISLSNNTFNENEYFVMQNRPRIIKKYNKDSFKSIYNMTYHPRRDFLKDNLKEFCLENNEGTILFTSDLQLLYSFAFRNTITPFWNSQAKFYIHLQILINNEVQKELTNIVQQLWNVYKTAHLIISCSFCSEIFVFIPIELQEEENRWGVLKRYEIRTVLKNLEVIEVDFENLNGYPIRATMFPGVMAKSIDKNRKKFEGADPILLNLLATKMNFTQIIILPPDNDQFGLRLPNGTFTGALGTLLTGAADLIPIGFFSMDYNTKDAELLGANMGDDDLCAVVHRAKIVPAWLAPVRYIGFDVCVLLAGVYIGLSIVWIIIKKSEHHPKTKTDTSLIFLNTIRLMLTASIPRISEATCERVFLAFSMIAFVTLAGTFQGTLVTVYSTLFFFPNIDSLKNLADTGMPILTRFESFKNDIFTDESNHVRGKLKDMVQIYKDEQKINQLIAEFGNFGGLIRRTSMDLDNDTNIYDTKGNLVLHVVKECIRTYGIAYMITKDSPFYHRMHQIILRTAQAGLFKKWYAEMARNNTKCWGTCQDKQQRQGNSDDNRPLSLTDLQLAAYQLISGLLISFVVFIFEIIKINIRSVY